MTCASGALAFRLPQLSNRPMHADEAVQAELFRRLWQHGRYKYNPDEFHGPTLNYSTLASTWISRPATFAETTETTYRIVPVLFGAGLVLVLWLLADALGRPTTLCAAVLMAISPAMVFYSRYYIHETLLVFFSLGAIALAWRYVRSGKLAWCVAAGVCVGLMQATKETAVLSYAAAVMATACAVLWGRLLRGCERMGLVPGSCLEKAEKDGLSSAPVPIPSQLPAVGSGEDFPCKPWWHLGLGLAAALLVAVLLFSSFFTNLRGPLDGVLTYLPWLRRAGGESPHVHPWYFYLCRLAWWRVGQGPRWSEGLILALAVGGLVFALFSRRSLRSIASVAFVRWLAFYTLWLTAAYSVIPYKTPWCLLQFLLGMILLAGVGSVALVRVVPTIPLKTIVTLLMVGAAGQLAWQSYRASFVMPADRENPYVYVHTLPDIKRFANDMQQITGATSAGRRLTIKVIWNDPYRWPLPWYLRQFEHVESSIGLPEDPSAPIVISSPEFDEQLTEKLRKTHRMTSLYGIRPNVLAQLWVRDDVWMAHLRRLGRL